MQWTFRATDYQSARKARREFTSYMRHLGAPVEAVHDATLIFGELVGNAVRHAGGEITARVSIDGSQPVLSVTDEAPEVSLQVVHPHPRSESGRGLKIAVALARELWVDRNAHTKTVSAVLPWSIVAAATGEKGRVPA